MEIEITPKIPQIIVILTGEKPNVYVGCMKTTNKSFIGNYSITVRGSCIQKINCSVYTFFFLLNHFPDWKQWGVEIILLFNTFKGHLCKENLVLNKNNAAHELHAVTTSRNFTKLAAICNLELKWRFKWHFPILLRTV
jgi:hypothetical protein